MSCIVYQACKMTGRDKHEQVQRAQFVSEVGTKYGLKVISPVLEENIEDDPGKLVNHDKEKLYEFWRRDKAIIRYEAHVVLLDHAEMKSFGMEREYCLARGVLWKPVVLVLKEGTALSVSQFEDDAVFYSIHAAMAFINKMWGTRTKRIVWRINMLRRSFPRWIWDQMWQWR